MFRFLTIFKKFFTVLVVAGVLFSNIPSYAVVGLIDSYATTRDVVDKIWLVQQDHSSDVVDNFSTLRNVSEKLRVMEAMAAITYQTNGAVAYSASAGTSVSPAYPTGVVANDLLVMIIGMKPAAANGGSVTTPAGWTPITSLTGAGGYGTTLGADTGNTNIFSFYKVAVGGETGTLAVTIAGNGVSWAQMYRLSAGAGSTWSVAGATGSDTTAGSVSIAMSTNPGVTAGDYIIGGMVIPTDVTTPAQFSAEALTQTGVTFSAVTEVAEPDSTTGNDIGGFTYRASVTAGTGTANPTLTATAGGTTTNVRGPGVFIRIREVPPANTTTISNFVSAEPGNSTIAPGASGLVDSFGLVTSAGTDTMTGGTVTLAAGTGVRVATVALTNDGDTVTYCSAAPSGDTATLTGCAIPITITNTQFKIKITAISHASMPAPPGATYDVTGRITAFTTTNTQAGTDSGSSTVTIDNLSPSGATAVSGTAGDAKVTLNWTSSASADFNTTSGSVIYRWASGTAGAEVPAEGSTPAIGSANGTATVACVVSSAASAVLSKIDGTGGSAECTTTALTNGQAYTYKVFQKDTNGNYDVGVSMGSFTPAAPVSLSSYTNTTETALNYAAACTSCGARIGSGAFLQTITLTGTNFGADPGVGNRSTATNNIKVGTHQIPTANVTAWSSTSITFTTNTANDSDASWGTVFGGAGAITVTAGGQTSSGLNFYVFPQVTSITSIVLDAAREYDAGDTDGVITLNGTRFGTAQSGGYVRILGCDSTTCSSPTGTVAVNSWSNTAIAVQVPTVIADNVYTGSVVMQQGTDSNNKTHTYTASGFRILPRITSLVASSGSAGDAITVNGNHLCQAGAGSCPVAFSATNKVTFTSAVDATVFTSWSNTAIVTQVPVGTATGNVVVTSNSYTSNGSLFTIVSPVPSDPTSLNQYRDTGLTQAIALAGAASSTPVYLTMTMQAGVSGGTLYPQIEYKDTSTNFTCVGTGACGSAVEGTGFSGPGPVDCTVSNCKIAISPSDNTYHWQARVRHNKSGVDYYSNWVSFGGNADPGATDFYVDTVAPVITLVSAGTPGSNSATITWSTSGELSTSQVQYAEGSPITFGTCSGDCTGITDTSPTVFSHSVPLSNLNSGTTYSFRVRSKDAAGNEGVSTPNNTFATQSVTNPAKTSVFHIMGKTGTVTNAVPLSQTFSVVMPENATSTKSIFVQLKGVYVSSSASPTLTVQVNSEPSKVYVLPTIAATSNFKVLHSVAGITVDPGTNTLTVTPDANTILYSLSADISVNYSYTP